MPLKTLSALRSVWELLMRNSARQKGHHFFPHFSLFIMKISERHTEREREKAKKKMLWDMKNERIKLSSSYLVSSLSLSLVPVLTNSQAKPNRREFWSMSTLAFRHQSKEDYAVCESLLKTLLSKSQLLLWGCQLSSYQWHHILSALLHMNIVVLKFQISLILLPFKLPSWCSVSRYELGAGKRSGQI